MAREFEPKFETVEDREKGRSDSRYNLIATWKELERLAPH